MESSSYLPRLRLVTMMAFTLLLAIAGACSGSPTATSGSSTRQSTASSGSQSQIAASNSPESAVRQTYEALSNSDNNAYLDSVDPLARGIPNTLVLTNILQKALVGLDIDLTKVSFREMTYKVEDTQQEWARVHVTGKMRLQNLATETLIDGYEIVHKVADRWYSSIESLCYSASGGCPLAASGLAKVVPWAKFTLGAVLEPGAAADLIKSQVTQSFYSLTDVQQGYKLVATVIWVQNLSQDWQSISLDSNSFSLNLIDSKEAKQAANIVPQRRMDPPSINVPPRASVQLVVRGSVPEQRTVKGMEVTVVASQNNQFVRGSIILNPSPNDAPKTLFPAGYSPQFEGSTVQLSCKQDRTVSLTARLSPNGVSVEVGVENDGGQRTRPAGYIGFTLLDGNGSISAGGMTTAWGNNSRVIDNYDDGALTQFWETNLLPDNKASGTFRILYPVTFGVKSRSPYVLIVEYKAPEGKNCSKTWALRLSQ